MPENPKCPRCGSDMVLRTARKGPNAGKQFYGCSKYPDCKGTISVVEQPSAAAVEPATAPAETVIIPEQQADVVTERPKLVIMENENSGPGESYAENVNPLIDNNVKITGEKLGQRAARYGKYGPESAETSVSLEKITKLFTDESVRDRVLEPFKELFTRNDDAEDKVRGIITQAAVVSAVTAGAGQGAGFGQNLSLSMETYMAYRIAKYEGMDISGPKDAMKYFGPLSAILGNISWIFKVIIGVLFSAFSPFLPKINPAVLAELMVTDFIGVVFWSGFQQFKMSGKFGMPASVGTKLMDETKKLADFQMQRAAELLTAENIRVCAGKLAEFLKT